MAWLKDRADKRQAAEAEQARARADQAEAEHRASVAAQALKLRDMVAVAREFRGFAADELEDRPPILLKKGERLFAVVHPVALVEPRVAAGHWEGRSQAVSFKIPGTRSARYRVGGSRGHYVKGEATPTPIDTGTCAVTGQRLVFVGPKYTREWLWAKTIAVDHRDDAGLTVIGVSNRQKASGIMYGDDVATEIRFRIDLAVAAANGTADDLADELAADLAHLDQELGLPAAPLPPGSALPPPSPPPD